MVFPFNGTRARYFHYRSRKRKSFIFFVVRAFDTKALMMHFVVVPVSEGLVVISLSAATPQKTASAFVDVYSAIEKRIIAIQGWIRQQAEAAEGTNLKQAVRGSP